MYLLTVLLSVTLLLEAHCYQDSELPEQSILEGNGEWCPSWKNLICGSDGITYWNECQYLKARDKVPDLGVVNVGACELPECDCSATEMEERICASSNYLLKSQCAYKCYKEEYPNANETYEGCRTMSPTVSEMEAASPEIIKKIVVNFLNMVLPSVAKRVRRSATASVNGGTVAVSGTGSAAAMSSNGHTLAATNVGGQTLATGIAGGQAMGAAGVGVQAVAAAGIGRQRVAATSNDGQGQTMAATSNGGHTLAATSNGGQTLAATSVGGQTVAATSIDGQGQTMAATSNGGQTLAVTDVGGQPLAVTTVGGQSLAATNLGGHSSATGGQIQQAMGAASDTTSGGSSSSVSHASFYVTNEPTIATHVVGMMSNPTDLMHQTILTPLRGSLNVNGTRLKFAGKKGWLREVTQMALPETYYISAEEPGRFMFRVNTPVLEFGYNHFSISSGRNKVNTGVRINVANVGMFLILDLVQESPTCTRLHPVAVRVAEFPERITTADNDALIASTFSIPTAELEDFMKEKFARHVNQALLDTMMTRMKHTPCLSFVDKPTSRAASEPSHCFGAFQTRYCSA